MCVALTVASFPIIEKPLTPIASVSVRVSDRFIFDFGQVGSAGYGLSYAQANAPGKMRAFAYGPGEKLSEEDNLKHPAMDGVVVLRVRFEFTSFNPDATMRVWANGTLLAERNTTSQERVANMCERSWPCIGLAARFALTARLEACADA